VEEQSWNKKWRYRCGKIFVKRARKVGTQQRDEIAMRAERTACEDCGVMKGGRKKTSSSEEGQKEAEKFRKKKDRLTGTCGDLVKKEAGKRQFRPDAPCFLTAP